MIILDEKERILLVNDAFADLFGAVGAPAIGTKINTLPWRMVDGSAQAGGYPWHTALREGREMREDFLSLRTPSGAVHNFNVNATVIAGDNKKSIGAIVTLNDMTALARNKEDLEKTAARLRQTEEEILRQRRELEFLANYDTLSGHLNRRAFMMRFTDDIEQSNARGTALALLRVDLDNFQYLNDNFGPAAGDSVIAGVAQIVTDCFGEPHYSARYGGDEFCIVVFAMDQDAVLSMSEQLRHAISNQSHLLLQGGMRVEVSIGVAFKDAENVSPDDLLHRAERAMNAAKRAGRNRSIVWNEKLAAIADGESEEKPTSDQGMIKTHAPEPTPGRELPIDPEAAANAAFFNRLSQSIERAARDDQPLAVLQMSVVSWDFLREALGDVMCDKLLRGIRQRISETLRVHDNILTINNSGELLIELSALDDDHDVSWLGNRLLNDMRDPFKVGDETIYVSCKVGAASFPDDGRDATALVRHAGVATRRALEENLLDGFKFYASAMTQDSKMRLDIESGIREALSNDEFEMFFQPIVDARTGALSAAEALLRCNNQRLSKVRIDQIVDVAEKSSLIAELDMWVLTTALKHMQSWCDAGIDLPKISINISAKQLTNTKFMDGVFETIKAVRFSPSRVQIEVTETAKMADVEVAAPQLKRLQQLGVQIALDDFGTGQASLTYLQRLHPDVIKIDRSFVDGVNTNHANATLVSAMTIMAHCLGLKVVVEGVEDEEQLEFLRETHCDEIQGYLISKPLSFGVMSDWMKLFVGINGTRDFVRDVNLENQPDSVTEAA